MIKILKTGQSITINGVSFTNSDVKCINYGSEIRIEHKNSVIVDKTSYLNIEYNNAVLTSADDLIALSSNLTT